MKKIQNRRKHHYHPHEFWAIPILIFAFASFVTIVLYTRGSAIFSGSSLLSGDLWRIFLFPFAHFSFNHFFENLAGLAIASILAFEVDLPKRVFIFSFLGASFLLASIATFLFPDILMAGASVGIYAVLGATALKGSKFFAGRWLFLIFILSIFSKYFILFFESSWLNFALMPSLFHFFGFISGFLIFAFYLKGNKEKIYF